MSTSYIIIGPRRLTYAKLAPHVKLAWKQAHTDKVFPIASRQEWLAAAKRDDSMLFAEMPDGNVIWTGVSPAGNVRDFERFGPNDASGFCALLEDLGVEWLSEHDDEYDHHF